MTLPWTLQCASCGATRDAAGLPGVCERCGQPYLVRYDSAPGPDAKARLRERGWTMWRYREWLPLADGEAPVSLGEGGTPLVALRRLGAKYGLPELALKDEGTNPTGSFKARGLAAAVTRAVGGGARRFVVPTAGNAGIALAAYAARAGASARVYAPRSTPPTILAQIRAFGAELVLVDGHIGDCGTEARAYAAESGAVDVSTLREPYRIEGGCGGRRRACTACRRAAARPWCGRSSPARSAVRRGPTRVPWRRVSEFRRRSATG